MLAVTLMMCAVSASAPSDVELIKKHEGLVFGKHWDTIGKCYDTGYGHRLLAGESPAMTKSDAEKYLAADVAKARRVVAAHGFNVSDDEGVVLVCMTYQLGERGAFAFKDAVAAMRSKDDVAAAAAMRDSKWYKQTPRRVEELIARLK
jgi:lysozyme